MKTKIVLETSENFGEKHDELVEQGYMPVLETYRVIEYCGKICNTIMFISPKIDKKIGKNIQKIKK